MNILRIVQQEKDKKEKLRPHMSKEFQKLEDQAASASGQAPIAYEEEDLRQRLTPMQYYVTQQKGTESAYSGKFLRHKGDGVYTCVVCENQLFRSEQKFDSGCGWPAFNDVMAQGKVTIKKDVSHGMQRIEAVCSQCGAHVGHVFDDGPRPTRLRYCVNSASLDFKKHTTV